MLQGNECSEEPNAGCQRLEKCLGRLLVQLGICTMANGQDIDFNDIDFQIEISWTALII